MRTIRRFGTLLPVAALAVAACAGPVAETGVGDTATPITAGPAPTGAVSPIAPSTYPVPDYGEDLPEEFPFILECIEWYGFTGEVKVNSITGEEGLVVDHGPEATDEFMTAITDCNRAWRELAGLPIGLPGPDELGEMYDRFLEIHRCLVEHGYPTEEPPSREVFIEDAGREVFADAADIPWGPYNALYVNEDVPDGLIAEAERACPPE